MTREDLKNIMPHREPMLLLDESYLDGEYEYSQYTIRENEFFTTGHFPGMPMVPGVILCEIMAQGSVLLIPKEDLEDNIALYAGIDGAKFKHSVFPGDTVCVKSHIINRRGPLVITEAEARVNGILCAKGKLSLMLTPKNK